MKDKRERKGKEQERKIKWRDEREGRLITERKKQLSVCLCSEGDWEEKEKKEGNQERRER